MLAKIRIIAGTGKSVSSCVQWNRRLYAHYWLVAKLPITIKNFRSAEQVCNVKKYVRCGVLIKSIGFHHSLLSATDEKSRYCLNDEALSEPPSVTEEGLLTVLRKPDNLAYKNNDECWINNNRKKRPNFRAFA